MANGQNAFAAAFVSERFRKRGICVAHLYSRWKVRVATMSGPPTATDLLKRTFVDPEVCRRIIYHRRAFEAAQYAWQRLSGDLNLQSTARAVNMEPCAFSRYFRQKTGVTFSSFVRCLRISAAAERLDTSDDAISQIARDCGFTNPATFIRSFKSVTSLTPTEYRKRALGGGTIHFIRGSTALK